jgi:hypothetical protein
VIGECPPLIPLDGNIWEGGMDMMTREPGDLPVAVVLSCGRVYQMMIEDVLA